MEVIILLKDFKTVWLVCYFYDIKITENNGKNI